jgi:hypothetical protein
MKGSIEHACRERAGLSESLKGAVSQMQTSR